ncbi:beta-lactamase/transpeptidase-like protein [Mycena leptocephala]|nr:beta-lactamase/transpeptidase-like protein [Mycena leptocephala]
MHLWQSILIAIHHPNETERFSCRPFLPPLFIQSPPHIDNNPHIRTASLRTGQFLESRFAEKDIDSLSVAVVSSDGVLFEANYGVVRGNESETSPATNSDSMYRIASVSKLFTVLEGHILAEKGVISWDDPVNKYLPDFKPRLDSSSVQLPITLFQLATHMSGWDVTGHQGTWPTGPKIYSAPAHRPPTDSPSQTTHLSSAPSQKPHSSRIPANRIANGPKEPSSYAELLKRDIFDPLGLNGSHFLTTDVNKHLVVVPSLAPEVADQDFLDAMNPAGGQFSSLRDSITVLQTLLNPDDRRSLIRKQTMDSWMHTFHAFEEDDWTEVGFLWEIIKARDSNNRLRKIYWKLGAMAGYHAALAIHPGTSYGVAVLLGDITPMQQKSPMTFSNFFNRRWINGQSSATVLVHKGSLYIENININGTDILPMFHSPNRVALRSTHHDKFRLDIGIPFYNGQMHMGCYPYWFSGDEAARRLHVPAVGVEMLRGR